ncbi:hypothetical protein I4U23_010748 [Adineta vaga]|nr:hypothetical protein I4U23_010748 [Adineta vaga]
MLMLPLSTQFDWLSSSYEMDDNSAHGVRCSGNDQFIVVAFNSFQCFMLYFYNNKSSIQMRIDYPYTNIYVYSLDIISTADNESFPKTYIFAYICESIELRHALFMRSNVTLFSNGKYNIKSQGNFILYEAHQEYLFLKTDPSQLYMYVFASRHIHIFDPVSSTFTSYVNMTKASLSFHVTGVDITATYAICVGLYIAPKMPYYSTYAAKLLLLGSMDFLNGITLHSTLFVTAQAFFYNRNNDISVAVNHRRHLAIIGLPVANTVVLLKINATLPNPDDWNLNIVRNEVGPMHCTGFGRSVVWINDTTVAVVVLIVPNRPWSQSEVWIFDVDKSFQIPLFIFPNNQQNFKYIPSPLFLQILFFSGNLVIVTDDISVLVVPSQPAGYVSTHNTEEKGLLFVLESVMCTPGTFKNVSGFGSCTICPPQTKNTGNQTYTVCEPCNNNSFCPLGSVGDVSFDNYPSYTQTFSYPNSPDMNNYDDLLVQNIFNMNYTKRCLVISPIFWTTIVIILCGIIWLLMALLQVCTSPKAHSRRTKAKQFLKRIDIVNEGERWVGGLFSFAIAVVFAFTIWFATNFLKLYPIEISDVSHISCDSTIRNAVFESALQLPLPNPDGNQWAIFNMLDNQPFIITVDLLNTAANCSDITVQQNRPGINYLLLPVTSCIRQLDNATLSVTFSLLEHRTNVQLNITGSYFIGGMRLCLRSPGFIEGVHRLETLDMCKLFFTPNETLARMTTLHMVLIKVINETKPLKIGSKTYYNGRWAPTFAENFFSDKSIYEQDGYYLRYISKRTIISITLSEQPFYLQNTQQPIVRRAELAFHTLLFCTLIIELFGMSFLLFRLVILPLIRTLRQCYNKKTQNNNMESFATLVGFYLLALTAIVIVGSMVNPSIALALTSLLSFKVSILIAVNQQQWQNYTSNASQFTYDFTTPFQQQYQSYRQQQSEQQQQQQRTRESSTKAKEETSLDLYNFSSVILES